MTKRNKVLAVGASALALGAGGAGLAFAGGGGDDDGSEVPITGSALDKASAAALDATGGGTVSETEVRDEEGYYEVEVTRSDGSQVDVHLNRSFDVLSEVGDSDDAGEDDAAGDD